MDAETKGRAMSDLEKLVRVVIQALPLLNANARIGLCSAILASDWLRDTLAAERERCAKVADGACAFDPPAQTAAAIRNLAPKEIDDAI